jgi:type IV secretory pathway TraG/TraD family ATPase VirD4
LFGQPGAQEIQESCGMQIILGGGIRDIESARRYADMVGKMTLEMNDPVAQAERAYQAETARYNALWQGGNPLDAERVYQHQHAQSERRRQTGRYAIDPAEIMRLNQQVLIFTPGVGLPPILANKLPPYWKNPAMAGRYRWIASWCSIRSGAQPTSGLSASPCPQNWPTGPITSMVKSPMSKAIRPGEFPTSHKGYAHNITSPNG